MNSDKVGTVKLTYYDATVTNKGKNPEVYYNCFGMAVTIPPGKTGTVRRVRRDVVNESDPKVTTTVPPATTPVEKATDGEEPEQPKGKNSKGRGKSSV